MTKPRFLPSSGFDPRDARRRIGPIMQALDAAYPGARTALAHHSPFELLIATILSAQCTDEVVNRVTPQLFGRWPDAAKLAAADPAQVEAIVRPTGFYRNKTRSIIACARGLVERFGGQVPRRIDDLVTLHGVARKTANVVLANCWPRPQSDHGIFVDTHVHRVSQRLALTAADDPVRIEQDLLQLVPEEKWADVPHQLILLGRGLCQARAPQHDVCPLLTWCPTGQEALGLKPGKRAGKPKAARARPKGSRVRR